MNSTGERWRLGHRPALDGLRGIAILLVVACHTLIDTRYLTTAGIVGVTLFFVLSGYLITGLLITEAEAGKIDLKRFYSRRAKRLLPALIAMLTLMPLWLWAASDPYLKDFWKEAIAAAAYARNMFFFERVPGYDGIMGHGWSLAVEEQFYLLWPAALLAALALCRKLRANPAALIGALAAALLAWRLYAQVRYPGWQTYGRLDTNAGGLLAGAAIALAETRGWTIRSAGVAYSSLVGLVLVAQYPAITPASNATVGVAATIFAAPLIARSSDTLPWLSDPLLRWFGRVSYGWYLWHFALQTTWINGHPPTTLWRLAAAAISLGLAAASYELVERRFLVRRRSVRPNELSPEPLTAPSGTQQFG